MANVVNKNTWEVYNDQRVEVVAAFRAYDSIYDFYKDQDLLFMISRYDRVRSAQSPKQQAQALQACGYATDPSYAAKLISIMESNGLQQYDITAEEDLPMTEGEKQAFQALQETVQQLSASLSVQNETVSQQEVKITALESRVSVLEGKYTMSVPSWAKDAVDGSNQSEAY